VRRLARGLLYGGVGLTVAALSKAHAAAHGYDWSSSSRFGWSLAYVCLLVTAAFGLGLPDLRCRRREAWLGATQAAAVAAGAISLLQLLVGSALLPRFVVFGAAALLVPWLVICARMVADGAGRDEERDRLVVVAPVADQVQLADELRRQPERVARVAGGLTPQAATSLVDGSSPLVALVESVGANLIVLSRDGQLDESVVAQAAEVHGAGVRVRTLSLFYEEWLGKLPASELEQVALLFDIGEVHRLRYGRLKRVVDLALAAIGVIGLAVITPLVVAGNLVANRGPLLYRQERVGKHGRPFVIAKFRTMRPAGPMSWTTADDPRVTTFGRFLRRSHLDELPQILNILRGDLSVVGPRPEQPQYVEELVAKLPFYDLRHLVRPGLTGWAQVKYGYAGDQRDALEKLQYEFFYLRRQGLALDLRIVGRTLRSVLGRNGR
jgi:lipopolysaccharide/colanic/teichoic acid biosynthesis glycosyltransferase